MGILTSLKFENVNFDTPAFRMVGGMNIDDVKIKYNWFLNASVENAIIGEDENGLVWYSGTWIDGVWEQGTWYSGCFCGGRWKSGSFYSYDLDIKEVLLGKLLINQVNINKSTFKGGSFEGGDFFYGIMGQPNLTIPIPFEINLDLILKNNIDYVFDLITKNHYNNGVIVNRPIFKGGNFHNGWINCVEVDGGVVEYAIVNNVYWKSGNFKTGVFLGDLWVSGNFYGGDFSNGVWQNGLFTVLSTNVKSRFGVNYKQNNNTVWESGVFENGELHSGLNQDSSGNPIPSISNSKCRWLNGSFNGGVIYGIYWVNGTLNSGTVMNGHFDKITVNNGIIKNCFCFDMTMNNGEYNGGFVKNFVFNGGKICYE